MALNIKSATNRAGLVPGRLVAAFIVGCIFSIIIVDYNIKVRYNLDNKRKGDQHMRANDKIYVSEYLKDLYKRVKGLHLDKLPSVKKITCKELAQRCEVTPTTITNLTTSSNFYLLYRISEEILDAYYPLFILEESKDKEEYPDETILPRDVSYVLMYLTRYYTAEWLNK